MVTITTMASTLMVASRRFDRAGGGTTARATTANGDAVAEPLAVGTPMEAKATTGAGVAVLPDRMEGAGVTVVMAMAGGETVAED